MYSIIINKKHKKLFLIVLFILIVLSNINVFAAETTLEKAFKEVMYSYYMRGENIQYNENKTIRKGISPEEITSQNKFYTGCDGYATSVYYELAGITIPWVSKLIDYGANSINNNRITKKEVIGYASNQNGKLVWYRRDNDPLINPKADDIIKLLQPGDIIKFRTDTHGGHTLLVYDLIYKNGQVDDVYLIHSWQSNEITSKVVDSGQRLMYDMLNSKYVNTNHVFVTDPSNPKVSGNPFMEGSVRITTLKNLYNDHKMPVFMFDYSNKTYNNYFNDNLRYVVLRFLTTDANGTIRLDYNDTVTDKKNYVNQKVTLSNKISDRIKYRKLFIEKTVNVGDNNVVANNSTLEYKIVIQNNSNSNYNNDLVVTEKLASNVVYSSFNSNKSITLTKDKTNLKWNIGKLKSGEKVTITYKVKTNGSDGDVITSTGSVGNIASGTIKNTIGRMLGSDIKNEIKAAYNTNKTKYSGVNLIDKIYNEVLGFNLNLVKVDINQMFCNSKNTYCIKENREKRNAFADNYVIDGLNYKNIVLNLYGRRLNAKNSDGKYTVKYWPGLNEDPPRMADTVFPNDFKTGDILLYNNTDDTPYKYVNGKKTSTKVKYEDGKYAYIYIEGEGFVGVNNKESGALVSRNNFNGEYYQKIGICLYAHKEDCLDSSVKDKLTFLNYQTLFAKDVYIIFRPSLGIDLKVNINYEKQSNKTKVTITANEKIKKISGWTLSSDEKSLTRTYTTNTQETITIYDKIGNKKDIKVSITGSTVGDVDGNGKIETKDYTMVRAHFYSKPKLTGESLKRADVNSDGMINVLDYMSIRKIILGSAN